MAKRLAREYVSKSDAIRQYLYEHADARPSEVVAALKSQGILISSALAAHIKRAGLGKRQRDASLAKTARAAPGKVLAGDKADAIGAQIDRQGQRFRPRDLIAALAAQGVDVSLAEVIAVAKSLGLRPRKQS
jgi:hypothetical protein